MTKKGFGDIVWCIMGDFNAIADPNERRGIGVSNLVGREVTEFREFISQMELVDLPLLGRQFTWFHTNGIAMSRLDRVLISPEWVTLWGNPCVWVAARDVSDHCLIILRYNNDDWGAKPFRFNNYWLQNKNSKRWLLMHGILKIVVVGWDMF
jgi:hypothetical protein